ncbi:YraN family protein [Altericroceibacterium endophyticum]|uniref:UPF0102 protein GRI91_01590 n=1 Tax=Altericroceibacterium endophyticum TaxID=1808508 RepID=A0A6I4T287_9SPHN|nr:YraN family protein [Altericroceibacterium endophyticum]MXO64452.1 hypothetical protein [Altericroceibacterium endophyticum]
MNRRQAERRGRNSERIAALYLGLSGWRLLASRVKTPRGEIDLIMRRGSTILFVEVKYRKAAKDWALALDAYRLRRVAAAVETIAHRYARRGENVRIDAVMLAPWRWPRHIVNAWQP